MQPTLTLGNVLAALVLLACLGLAVRMLLRPAQQRRLDQALRKAGYRLRETLTSLWHWRSRKQVEKSAAEEAAAAIRRAKSKPEGEWDGNVYRPTHFRDKKDKGRMH